MRYYLSYNPVGSYWYIRRQLHVNDDARVWRMVSHEGRSKWLTKEDFTRFFELKGVAVTLKHARNSLYRVTFTPNVTLNVIEYTEGMKP